MLSVNQTQACFCVYTFLSSTLLFAGTWKVAEAFLFATPNIALWYMLGFPFSCLALFSLTYLVLSEHGGGFCSIVCHFGFLVILANMSWFALAFDAIKDYPELELTRQGLEASAAPGWASVNCMSDADPQSIDVRTDRFTYFTLADPQWRVASENHSVVKREEGWVWAVAPIEYVGPVHGCRTKYPLFAVCVDSAFNNANCGWEAHKTGSWTYMRLLTAHGKIGVADRKPFWDEWVPNPYDPSQKVKLHHENLFEFDSVSYDEAARMVAEKGKAYDEFVMWYAVAWFAVTVPLLLWACVWLLRKDRREAKSCAKVEAEEECCEEQDRMDNERSDPMLAPPTPPVATPPSPPVSTPEALHPLIAPPSEYTPPSVWPVPEPLEHVPFEQSRGDGRVHFSGLRGHPWQHWDVHARDATEPALHHGHMPPHWGVHAPWPRPTPPRWAPLTGYTPPVLAEPLRVPFEQERTNAGLAEPRAKPFEQSWGGREVPPEWRAGWGREPALQHTPWQTRPFAPVDTPWRPPASRIRTPPYAAGDAHAII